VRTDVVVIGGGVVGLAAALRLAERGMGVVLLERHPSFGRETSSRNSGVIHAGMYYPAGSLKARYCVAGNPAVYAWCSARGVPTARLGKFIVATSDEEVPLLESILTRGHANGVAALRRAGRDELHAAEPLVAATAALFSPDTGIVDPHAFMQSLADAAAATGVVLAWGHDFTGAEPAAGGYRVSFRDPTGGAGAIVARRVVNAAGLGADLIAAGMGLDIDALEYRVRYVRGSYFRLHESWRGRLTHLIYPVPHAGLTGLGCHVTLQLDGAVLLGPDAEGLDGRTPDYAVAPGRAAQFADAVRRYLPDVTAEQLRPDQAGIRPRRILADGATSPDFVIAEESARGLPGWVNLIGIESPGLTCCLPIGTHVAELVGDS
jgi:L-2-hydroxyglutarate oxidase LhgO